ARELRTGAVRWHQPLPGAPLGRPVFDGDNRLYVPTAGDSGLVYDFDARTGTLLGQFETGQPLAGGAALDRTYNRLYVPAYGYHEKIALVTDAGALGLFGIQQARNSDDPLFPLLGSDPPAAEGARQPLRAQLVHAEEDGFWVLAGGALQYWRLGLDRARGLTLAPMWGDGLRPGSPLHAGQISADRLTLYLETQTAAPTAWLA